MQNFRIMHTKSSFLWAALLVWPAAAALAQVQPEPQPESQPSPLAPGQGPSTPAAPNPIAQGYTGASTAMPAITVTAPRILEAEPTDSASERRISGETLNTRPISRPGEMLEAVPGL